MWYCVLCTPPILCKLPLSFSHFCFYNKIRWHCLGWGHGYIYLFINPFRGDYFFKREGKTILTELPALKVKNILKLKFNTERNVRTRKSLKMYCCTIPAVKRSRITWKQNGQVLTSKQQRSQQTLCLHGMKVTTDSCSPHTEHVLVKEAKKLSRFLTLPVWPALGDLKQIRYFMHKQECLFLNS